MTSPIPARLLLALSVLTALATGALLQPSPVPSLPLYWQVQVTLDKNGPPVIESAQLVQVTHPPRLQLGEAVIQLLSPGGEVLASQTFQPDFASGELPGGATRVPYLFTLPDHPQAVQVLVRTAQGEARYDLRR